MKASVLLCALALPMAMAENAFIDMTVHGLAKYFGLSAERQQQNKFESVKDKTPKVKNFGFNAIKKTDHENPWGVDLGINFDIGLSYELPLYNVDNYLVMRQRLHTYVGGRQYVSFFLGYFRLHFFFDIWPVRCTFFDNYLQFDIVSYDNWCNASNWFLDTLLLQFFTQLDVNECLIGLVGQFTESTPDCVWSTYYVNHPLFNYNIYYPRLEGKIFKNTCGDVPPYDYEETKMDKKSAEELVEEIEAEDASDF